MRFYALALTVTGLSTPWPAQITPRIVFGT
jgi:hypothetical protein